MATPAALLKTDAPVDILFRRLAVAPDYSAASGGSILATWSKSSVPVFSAGTKSASELPSFSLDCSAPCVTLPYPAIDVAWCPFKEGSSCASFFTACRSSPLQLWDIEDSSLRASYCCYNASGIQANPYAVLWSKCRTFVAGGYGGFEDDFHVRFYDLLCEGNTAHLLYRSPCSKGIVSALSDGPAPYQENMILAGFIRSGNVDIIDTRHCGAAAVLRGLRSGVTQIQAHPTAEHHVYAAGRLGDGRIVCWDIRKSNQVLATFDRKLCTQQTAFFGFVRPRCGGLRRVCLVSATHDGGVLVFDTTAAADEPRRVQSMLGLTAGLTVLDDDGTIAVTVGRRYFPVRDTYGAGEDLLVNTLRPVKRARTSLGDSGVVFESESEGDSEEQKETGGIAVFKV